MKYTENQHNVQRLLQWSEMQYAEYVYETGISYLTAYLQDALWVDEIIRSAIFWNWWKKQWHLRDVEFVRYACLSKSAHTLAQLYQELHNAQALAKCMHPHAIILEESYAEMIQKLIKEAQKKAEKAHLHHAKQKKAKHKK